MRGRIRTSADNQGTKWLKRDMQEAGGRGMKKLDYIDGLKGMGASVSAGASVGAGCL